MRKRNGKLIFLTCSMLLGIVPSIAVAQFMDEGDPGFNKGGRTAFQFVKIGVGARQVGMGEAAIASVRDVNAVFWNPAGISGIRNAEVTMSYNRWLGDMNYLAAAAGYRWNGVGVFALQIASLSYGEIPEAIVQEGDAPGDARTGNTFTGDDFMAGLSYSREFTDRLSIGFTLRFMRETLWEYAANAASFDVGTYYDTGFQGIRIGMSAQNYSPWRANWLDVEGTDRARGYDLPLLFRVGLSMGVVQPHDGLIDAGPSHRLDVNAETVNSNDYGERLHLGAEYIFSDFLAFRGGYRLNYADGNLTLGFGLMQDTRAFRFNLDYAYVGYEFLNAPHRLTVTLGF